MDTDGHVESVDVTDVDGQLGDLLTKIAAGVRLQLIRDGIPVAWLTAADPIRRRTTTEERDPATARKRIRAADLATLTDGMTFQTESAGDFMRRMRDDERY